MKTPTIIFLLTIDSAHHLLEIAPDGGETDSPAASAGGDHYCAVTGPQLITDAGQAVVTPPLVNTSRLIIIITMIIITISIMIVIITWTSTMPTTGL